MRKNVKYTFVNSDLKIEGFESDKVSPQKVQTAVTFKTRTSGEVGEVKYKYYRYLNGEYALIKDWSTSNTITIAPKNIGEYEICVAAKDSNGFIVRKTTKYIFN